MCTVILLHRPGHDWPILIAANRDEMAGRPWQSPARHWEDRPDVTAGLDVLAGGSWLGLNDHGVAAAILNRVGT
ncbi:MAG: NRDE family protein, partial [Oceanibaculum nanhaiense]|nr:NRDE family protein [Oceanibaculum nanhaiense]